MSQPRGSRNVPPSPDRTRRTSADRHRHGSRRRRPSDVESPSHRRQHSVTRSGSKQGARETVSRNPPSDDRLPTRAQSGAGDFSRKKSLIRPERHRMDSNDPNFYYRQHAQRMDVRPSATGNDPTVDDERDIDATTEATDPRSESTLAPEPHAVQSDPKRPRARSDALQKSGGSRRKRTNTTDIEAEKRERKRQQKAQEAHAPPSFWITYCHMITFWCPGFVLRCFGKPQKAQQRAWREKMGLISIILLICLFVGYLTFGFTQTVCPNGGPTRLRVNHVGSGYIIIHGVAYDVSRSQHPYAIGVPAGSNIAYEPLNLGGQDASFMFQNVNGHCKGLIVASPDSDVPTNSNGDLGWYFPCNTYKQDGSSEPDLKIPYYLGYSCHLSSTGRQAYYGLESSSDVYFTWSDVKNSTRNLAVWGEDVIDLDLLQWFNTSQVQYPTRFDEIRENPSVRGTDLSLVLTSSGDKQIANCFSEIIKVGTIDTETIGCIASKVVLYVSLVFILSVVMAKFLLALIFQWFLCKKYEAMGAASNKSSKKRAQEIEDWADDIYRPAPRTDDAQLAAMTERSKRSSAFLPSHSRFTSPYAIEQSLARKNYQPTTMASQSHSSQTRLLPPNAPYTTDASRDSRTSLMSSERTGDRFSHVISESSEGPGPAGFVHESVVPQPPPEWQPFGYPLAHTICLVTAYSEGADGMRTTFDSIAVTDYPNSHKIILVICDGLVKGKGEEFSTPEIAIGMMKDYTILPDEVQPFSYVAVAGGSKRHNMAKVYSGFYDYGENSRIPADKQQRVPMVVIVKCGTPSEAKTAKPGNRGKRDSQIILMSFLQKVMFDERMTELEFEMFNGIWKITGISPDFYEIVLMVDADTKVFPDCLTHMVSAMVKDPEVMGLCGETKIANKRESWVTMIQVFEYFISHHLAKSFESVFGGVTCLPGCFSAYRIKSPKGGQNYWVPILANPDIVEHYSENVVDTLHKKNLLLLGEDRYLSTLMLRTFPKRKQIFVPQAVCKTTVPEKFKVLLSQRRRWINSTIHNLMELVLVRDLCGTFCFSMQFVVFIELIGTLVLPAAISFTIYLITISIVDGALGKEIPVIPLVLLALILGLPAVLIVLTAKRWSYVAWMFIYLLSLPLWNGILPTYAYWKFDDFSWGDTRQTAGAKEKGGHGDIEGEFDSSKITMKRWGDFEMERRLKGGQMNIRAPPSAWDNKGSRKSHAGGFL